MSNGPYFDGQKTSASCGHYYPDVIRLKDECQNGEHFRVADCVFCGQYTVPLLEGSPCPAVVERSDEQLREFREYERQRLRQMNEV